MIDHGIVQQIQRLLANGQMSQRAIVRITGVSRITIARIASGRRPDHSQRLEARAEEEWLPVGPPRRCGGCGGLVYMPCLLCRVREQKRHDRELRHAG